MENTLRPSANACGPRSSAAPLAIPLHVGQESASAAPSSSFVAPYGAPESRPFGPEKNLPNVGTGVLADLIPSPTCLNAGGAPLLWSPLPDLPLNCSLGEKYEALARLELAHLPLAEEAQCLRRILAAVRLSLSIRDLNDPKIFGFVIEYAKSSKGGKLPNPPDMFELLAGKSFVIAGQSGSGKTEVIKALRRLLGGPQYVKLEGTGPAFTRFIPTLVVKVPFGCTYEEFIAAIETALNSNLGPRANYRFHGNENAAMSALALLSVGVFIVDGCGINSIGRELYRIYDFLARLPERVGIPTVVTCTYPVLQFLKPRGGAALADASAAVFELRPPQPERCEKYCETLWKWGAFSNIPMPHFIPKVVHALTFGNMRWMVECLTALFYAFADGVLRPEKLTERDFTLFVGKQLAVYSEVMAVLSDVNRLIAPNIEELHIYGDYLPRIAFSNRVGDSLGADFNARARRRLSSGVRPRKEKKQTDQKEKNPAPS